MTKGKANETGFTNLKTNYQPLGAENIKKLVAEELKKITVSKEWKKANLTSDTIASGLAILVGELRINLKSSELSKEVGNAVESMAKLLTSKEGRLLIRSCTLNPEAFLAINNEMQARLGISVGQGGEKNSDFVQAMNQNMLQMAVAGKSPEEYAKLAKVIVDTAVALKETFKTDPIKSATNINYISVSMTLQQAFSNHFPEGLGSDEKNAAALKFMAQKFVSGSKNSLKVTKEMEDLLKSPAGKSYVEHGATLRPEQSAGITKLLQKYKLNAGQSIELFNTIASRMPPSNDKKYLDSVSKELKANSTSRWFRKDDLNVEEATKALKEIKLTVEAAQTKVEQAPQQSQLEPKKVAPPASPPTPEVKPTATLGAKPTATPEVKPTVAAGVVKKAPPPLTPEVKPTIAPEVKPTTAAPEVTAPSTPPAPPPPSDPPPPRPDLARSLVGQVKTIMDRYNNVPQNEVDQLDINKLQNKAKTQELTQVDIEIDWDGNKAPKEQIQKLYDALKAVETPSSAEKEQLQKNYKFLEGQLVALEGKKRGEQQSPPPTAPKAPPAPPPPPPKVEPQVQAAATNEAPKAPSTGSLLDQIEKGTQLKKVELPPDAKKQVGGLVDTLKDTMAKYRKDIEGNDKVEDKLDIPKLLEEAKTKVLTEKDIEIDGWEAPKEQIQQLHDTLKQVANAPGPQNKAQLEANCAFLKQHGAVDKEQGYGQSK